MRQHHRWNGARTATDEPDKTALSALSVGRHAKFLAMFHRIEKQSEGRRYLSNRSVVSDAEWEHEQPRSDNFDQLCI